MRVYSNVEILFGWFQILKTVLQSLEKTANVTVRKWTLIVFYAIYHVYMYIVHMYIVHMNVYTFW